MNQWVDFREPKQRIGIEQELASYRVELKRVGHNQLRGPARLPSGRQPDQLSSAEIGHILGGASRAPGA
jgi:hypothetical protein